MPKQFLTQYYMIDMIVFSYIVWTSDTYPIQGLIETYVEIGGKKIDKAEDMKESCVYYSPPNDVHRWL